MNLEREEYNQSAKILVDTVIWIAGTVNIISSAWTREMFPLMEYFWEYESI
jgi:hypothetical protein